MADKDKQVYLTRKSGSTFSNATVNIKDSASAKKRGYMVFKSAAERKAWQDKNRHWILLIHTLLHEGAFMEFSCKELLDTIPSEQYKTLKFGGVPDVCIGLFGKANTKSFEQL